MEQFPHVVNLEIYLYHPEDLEFSLKEEIEEIVNITPVDVVNDWKKIIPNNRFLMFENIINYMIYNGIKTQEYITDIENLKVGLYQKINNTFESYKQLLETNKYFIVYLERSDIDNVKNNQPIDSTYYTNIIQQNQGIKCPDNQFSIIKNTNNGVDTYTKIPCCDTICPQNRLKLGTLAMSQFDNVIIEDGKYYWFIISHTAYKSL